MSDNEEKKRPNANYKLSRDITDPEGIVRHYSREHRLAKAPQAVRDLYEEKPTRRFGIFRSLVSTKPNALLFFSIVVLCLIIFVLSSLDLIGDTWNLEGNRLSIQAFNYEGTIIVAITKTIRNNALSFFSTAYTGEVTIAVLTSADIHAENIFPQRIFFTLEKEEFFRFSVPFDTDELLLVFHTEKNRLSTTVKVDKH
ncbi:MAG: hypothetical protein FWG89_05090 [Treponema sp.]|nr:hypothetical protein [Treponema sp.]